jgi:hypothetical protein
VAFLAEATHARVDCIFIHWCKNKLNSPHYIGLFLVWCVSLYFLIPELNTPVYWDEVTLSALPLIHLQRAGWVSALPGLYPAELFLGHPPGFSWLTLLALEFGGGLFSLRILMLLLWSGSLWVVFRLGERIHGPILGLSAALAMVGSHMMVAFSLQILADVSLVFFGLLHVYFTLTRGPQQNLAMRALGCFVALLKETALAITLPCALWSFFHRPRGRRWPNFLADFSPVIVTAAFFLGEKARTGRFSSFPFMNTFVTGPVSYLENLPAVLWLFMVIQPAGQKIVFALAILGVARLLFRLDFRHPTTLFYGIIGCFFGGVSLLTEWNSRYFAPCVPLLLLCGLFTALKWVRKQKLVLVFIFLAALFGGSFRAYYAPPPEGEEGMVPDNLFAYYSYVKSQQEVLSEIARNFSQSSFAAGWPHEFILTDPFFGYVKSPLNVVPRGKEGEAKIYLISSDTPENTRSRLGAYYDSAKEIARYRAGPYGVIVLFGPRSRGAGLSTPR